MSQSHTNCITLAEWLPVLQRWYPPAHAMVVGDDDLPRQHLDTCRGGQGITIFKAGNPLNQAVQAHPLGQPVPQPARHPASPGPAIHPWFIASHTGPTSYHRASLPAHSGLLPTEALQCCWPNIKTVGQKTVNALSLDAAVNQASRTGPAPSEPLAPDWLWVNCLPALPILQGATQTLQSAQVVLARVILHPAGVVDAALPPLQQLLAGQGFMLSGVQPERNPQLGIAVFVRDYAAAKQAETQAKLLEAQAKLELLQKHELLAQTHKALEADLAQNRKALADAQAAHEAAQKAAQAELAQQAQAITALTQARDAEAKAKQTAQQTQTELEQRLQKLQAEHLETTHRQQLMGQELLKAEAQIELIKDLLLSEPRGAHPPPESPAL